MEEDDLVKKDLEKKVLHGRITVFICIVSLVSVIVQTFLLVTSPRDGESESYIALMFFTLIEIVLTFFASIFGWYYCKKDVPSLDQCVL